MDKKTIIYVVIIGLLMIGWFPLMEKLGISQPDSPPASDSTLVIENTPVEQSLTGEQLDTEPLDQTFSETTPPVETTITDTTTAEILPVDTITIRTNKYTIDMSSLGGGPVSMLLNDYTYRDKQPIQMLPNAQNATPNISFAGGSLSLNDKHFSSNKLSGSYEISSQPLDIVYTWESPAGATIVKTYTFHPDEYHYDLTISIQNPERQGLTSRYSLEWNTPLGITEPQPQTDYEVMEAAAMLGNSREKLDDWDDGRLRQSIDGYVSWAGVRSKYFAALFIPKNRDAESVFANGLKDQISLPDGEKIERKRITAGVNMPFASSTTDSFQVFVGPLDYQILTDYNVELDDILDIGTTPFVGWLIKLFAIPIMHFLPWMYDFVPNYGLVIIIFALLVKLITMPLSAKSFKSMNAMKELQPKIEALKKKYKDNPQQLNAETMKMYKAHGVNPIGGCLPMLPQMPLFFALFSVFRSTILLRDAPFVWFIDDLSRGAQSYTDPYMILVVIMVVGQFFSQQLTMSSNQQNKMLLYIMPLFMGWIFHSFAAGLVLYWACFSIFSLLDYVVFKRNSTKNTEVQTS